MLTLKTTGQFQKDYKKAVKSGRDITRLKQVMTWIAKEHVLPPVLRDHKINSTQEGSKRTCVAQLYFTNFNLRLSVFHICC